MGSVSPSISPVARIPHAIAVKIPLVGIEGESTVVTEIGNTIPVRIENNSDQAVAGGTATGSPNTVNSASVISSVSLSPLAVFVVTVKSISPSVCVGKGTLVSSTATATSPEFAVNWHEAVPPENIDGLCTAAEIDIGVKPGVEGQSERERSDTRAFDKINRNRYGLSRNSGG
ncbi:MAG: hypothetical protein U5O39_20735 [Gammaproteobacteria bacterium]|nr:hypothetical protein [Gammaproteobacteria bacterium]